MIFGQSANTFSVDLGERLPPNDFRGYVARRKVQLAAELVCKVHVVPLCRETIEEIDKVLVWADCPSRPASQPRKAYEREPAKLRPQRNARIKTLTMFAAR